MRRKRRRRKKRRWKKKTAEKEKAEVGKAAVEKSEKEKAEREKEEELNSKEQKAESDDSKLKTSLGDDFLDVDLTESNVVGTLKSEEGSEEENEPPPKGPKEENDWRTKCFEKWSEYPCKLGFRHGCKNGICWSQCNAAWTVTWGSSEWCYVYEDNPNVGGDDDEDWKYLACKTNADCTKQFAFRRKCKGACSLGL